MKLSLIKYLVFALAIVTTIIAGCGDDTEKKLDPTITVDAATVANNAEFTLKDGLPQKFTLAFSANKGADGKDLQTMRITVSYDGAAAVSLQPDQTITTGASFRFSQEFSTRSVKGTEKYTVTVLDKDGKSASFTRSITVKEEGGPVIDKPLAVNASLSNANPCLNSTTGQAYSLSAGQGVASTIDLSYFWSATSLDNLVSPVYRSNDLFGEFKFAWGSVSTELRKTSLTQADFNRLKDEDQKNLSAEFDKGTATVVPTNEPGRRASGNAGDVKPGNVLAYKANNKVGLILINSVAGSTTGSLGISIIRQK